MKTITLTLALTFATMAITCAAFASDDKPEVSKKPVFAGQFIAKDDLPQVVKEQSAKKEPKFPGIPSCAKGRVLLTNHDSEPLLTWAGEHQDHKCFGADKLYVCASFGKLSVRCEGGK
jgi:hypothetical protein